MTPLDTGRTALQALQASRLRSALTMLGVIIGIAAVVTMVTVGRAAQRSIESQIASLGSNVLLIVPVAQSGSHDQPESRQARLTEAMARTLKERIPAIVAAAPTISARVQTVYGNRNWSSTLQGVDPEYLKARDWRVAEGRPLTTWDEQTAAKVAVIGSTVAARLFGDANPLGAQIRVDNQAMAVVGVLAPKGHGVGTADQNDLLLVPLRTARVRFSGHYRTFAGGVDVIVVRFDGAPAGQVRAQIAEVLHTPRGRASGDEAAFRTLAMTDTLETQAAATERLNFLLAAVASVSLLVGGVGIMNMMLVCVTERTREIGVRRAIGASRRDIRSQFLAEAAMLSTVGGTAGAAVAVAASVALTRAMGIPFAWDPGILVAAVLASTAIGLFFGYYPAHRAAAREPADALRHE
jgi:putative ABC transport system permease protein